jgi:2-oxoglutarate dehydrogenase E2 component (dihydrolipoamide succinyltransferase)
MKVEIKVPSVGESVVEGTVGMIFKQSGARVTVDEEILELETDKVNQPIYSPAAGLLHLSVKAGEVVKIGQVIGSVDTEMNGQEEKEEKPSSAPAPAKKTLPPEPTVVEQAKEAVQEKAPVSRESGGFIRKRLSKLRRTIGERLVKVKNETAMLTTFNEVDMSALMLLRTQEQENFQKKHGVKLGFMSFFVKASVQALKEFPEINARIEGDEIVYPQFIHIGVAVGTDKGLFVPVLRNADKLSSSEIEKALKELAEKARQGTISVDDLQGGTFTITNGGVYGSMLSTPILNPPQSGILAMHNIVKRPVVVNDEIVIRPIMYLALSYDHRIVDGKDSIGFLVKVKEGLEDPLKLFLN